MKNLLSFGFVLFIMFGCYGQDHKITKETNNRITIESASGEERTYTVVQKMTPPKNTQKEYLYLLDAKLSRIIVMRQSNIGSKVKSKFRNTYNVQLMEYKNDGGGYLIYLNPKIHI